MSFRTTLAALAIAAAALLGAPASAQDAKLLAAARAAEPQVIESLREMVAIESGSGDASGVRRMLDYVQARLVALGAQPERLKPASGHAEMVKAVFTGTGRRNLLLIAHVDTVYGSGILASQPFRRDGNKLYGPGIADAKGGVAVILHTLALLKDAGWRDYARLGVLFNADEEVGSIDSGETLAALGEASDVVLSYEPSPAKEVLKAEGVLLAAAGGGSIRMEVKGRASHAGAAPQLGRNALIELAHQLLQTQDVAKGVTGAQLNWTMVDAISTRNQIPDKAAAQSDLRFTAPGAPEALLAAVRAKVAESRRVPDTETTVSMTITRPPYVAGDKGKALAERARAIYAELDGRQLAFIPGTGGGTDAGYAGRSGKPAVLEALGLAGWGYHARDEFIEIDSIVPRLYLSARLLMDLGRER
ncbi:MAG: glutamate carboxypeptidase [Rubrivivax sp.]